MKEDSQFDRPPGVIIPPPEIKKVIEKTAFYVAKSGREMEKMLKKDENNPKISFIRESDPYHSYYQYYVAKLIKEQISKVDPVTEVKQEKTKIENERKKQQEEIRKMIEEKKEEKEIEVRPPPPDLFTLHHPTNITPLEMDIIKITAQFVARNGQSFLTGISERERNNQQYDFLKPTNRLFGYFTNLVGKYTSTLAPPNSRIQLMKSYITDTNLILKNAQERHLYEKKHKETQKKIDEQDEKERMEAAQIDWLDFVVVETIDFREDERNMNRGVGAFPPQQQRPPIPINTPRVPEMPKPKNISEKIDFSEADDLEMKNREDEVNPPEDVVTETLPEPNMKIVKNYTRRQDNKAKAEQTQRCPLCKQNISINDYSEHLRIELLDPKWRELKQEMLERKMEISLASSEETLGYLNNFSKYRPDLFGEVNEEVNLEDKKKTENLNQNIKYGGYAENVTRTTASMAKLKQQMNKDKGEERTTSTLTGLNQVIPPKSTQATVTKPTTTSTIDRNAILIPEDIWLLNNPNEVKIHVKIPGYSDDKHTFKDHVMTVSTKLEITIGKLKELISTNLNSFSSKRMTLKSFYRGDLQNNHSLAFYNLSDESYVDLLIK